MNAPQIRERAVDRALEHWVRQRGGSDLLAAAAYLACRDEGEGHSCTRLTAESGFDTATLAALQAHAWVGDGEGFTPFVLRPDGDFYTWRNWRHEKRLAAVLRARTGMRTPPVEDTILRADIAELFAGTDARATQRQREAVAKALESRLIVVTGGAGTGKTTTVLRMLLELLHRAQASGLPERPSIALAAPTGKAALRMAQALDHGRHALLNSLPSGSAFRNLLEAIPYAQAQTLHRLLRYNPRDNSFAHSAASPLAADIVVVDETSMVDLAMMRQLADAVRPEAVLILLGDPAQLYAVEAGSVLGDIAAAAARKGSPMQTAVVELDHVWRSGGSLQHAIGALRRGEPEVVDAMIAGGGDDHLRWRDAPGPATLRELLAAWCERHARSFSALMKPDIAAREALDALRSMQLLCALRDGAFGAEGVNAALTRHLGARFAFDAEREWYHGRPVIITRNDYTRDLFNGDTGIALEGSDGLRVWFEARDRGGAVGVRSYSVRTLPTHDTGWAITVHRSQGSEYGDVAVILPPEPDQRILSRELLYTAVSRARASAEIWTSAGALSAAIRRPIQRRGGLRGMLA